MLFKKKVTWNYKDSPIRTKTINVFSPSVPSSKSSTGIYSRSSSDIIRYLPAYFRTLSKFRLSELSACINLKMGKANPPNGFTFTVYTINSWHCLQQKKGFYENEWRIFPFWSVWLMAGKEHMCFVHNVIIFESNLTFLKLSIIFRGSWGSCVSWVELEIDKSSANLACPNPWNTLYVFDSFKGKWFRNPRPQRSIEKFSEENIVL